MIRKNKNAFTLVELLAVIVILAIILVIAVPKIMNVIKDTTKASLESSAKMVAAQVENQYTVAQTLGKEFGDTGSCMQDWAGLNDVDYASCTYEVTSDGTAKVTIKGQGKFKGLYACNATRSSATVTEGECPLTCKSDEVLINIYNATKPYVLKNKESCNTYISNAAQKADIYDIWSETIESLCNGEDVENMTFDDAIKTFLSEGLSTESDLIVNNVIEGISTKNCVQETSSECFDFDSSTGSITGYDISCGTNVVIPSKINNATVTNIAENAFVENRTYGIGLGITSVIFPNTITTIEIDAFYGNLISELVIPSSVTEIGGTAFYGNPLVKVELANPNIEMGCDAFGDPSDLEVHNLPQDYEQCT